MLSEWTLSKLEPLKNQTCVLIRDSLRLLPEANGLIHNFARDNGFTVIVASTNLVFREFYERAIANPDIKKLLVLDRAPIRRRTQRSVAKAPPPFYPDLLDRVTSESVIDLDLRQFLRDQTNDPNWPAETNDPRYARLIVRHLDEVLRAHKNLRVADHQRFTDHDFKIVVAYATLGVADSAFKAMDSESYWKIGLLGHEALEDVEKIAPEIVKPIKDELRKAPAPFFWFAEHDAYTVLRAFYISAILAQHFDKWNLLLANVDPSLSGFTGIKPEILDEAAPNLIRMDQHQADKDLGQVEKSISKDAIKLLLLDELKLAEPENFLKVIEREKYSTLFRSLSLLTALDNLLSTNPNKQVHNRLCDLILGDKEDEGFAFVENRPSEAWSQLKDAYSLATEITNIMADLSTTIKNLKVIKTNQLTFKFFQDLWNMKKINRLEYYVSALERLVSSADFLPRHEDGLPSYFSNALDRIKSRSRELTNDLGKKLDEINVRFQELIFAQYPTWVKTESEVRLTSQFLKRCLKPHWDPQTERAALFIFDGMRYDIWDELLRPRLEERLEVLEDYPAISILPSETHVTRKAISAGTFPDKFDTKYRLFV